MVVVLMILGILISIACPGISQVSDTARKAKARSSLKAIPSAYRQSMEDAGHPIRWKRLDGVMDGTAGYDATLIAAI
jgi:type II secretory pathway pseudopilin PulG